MTESNADAAARERVGVVEEAMHAILLMSEVSGAYLYCPECDSPVADFYLSRLAHLATCELLRERAEREVGNG